MPAPDSRQEAFLRLHANGCFVIPNPWDVGSAKYLRHLGFRALATTSAGFAFSQGLPDGAVDCDSMLKHIADIVAATDLPVNADFAEGFADHPQGVAHNVERCLATGVAGLSIEDATGNLANPLYEVSLAVDRIAAARDAITQSRSGVLLTARAECYLVGHRSPFAESIRRLQAYSHAGADVLYAPGVSKSEEISTLVAAVAPKPVNFLMSSNLGLTVPDIAALGVRRISVGSSLARTAWSGFAAAARQIAEQGSFTGFNTIFPFGELNDLFRT